jgi:streptomycin 6-kinase
VRGRCPRDGTSPAIDAGSRLTLRAALEHGTEVVLKVQFKDDIGSLHEAAWVMQRLWRPPSDDVPWRSLEAVAEQWLDGLPARYEHHGRPFERRLFDEALDAMRTLGPSQEDVVLCHTDLHGGNMLSAEPEPWLAIDPKPIVAERAYDTVAIVRDGPLEGLGAADVRRRIDRFAELLGLDRYRMRGWGIAKHVAWGLRGHLRQDDLEQARRIAQAFG